MIQTHALGMTKVIGGYVLLVGNPKAVDSYSIELDKLPNEIFWTTSPYNQERCTDFCTEKFRAGT